MQIAIVGSGYVGLVTGACFAEFGYHVTCVDQDALKIENLKRGIIPIFEPGLDSLVQHTQRTGRLSFTTDLKETVARADAVFIAVGTPSRRGDGYADLSYVFQAAEEIAKAIEGYTVIITKSTVPVGTCRKVAEIITITNPLADFDVASNPEFLREGSAISDFMRPDRVVIGTQSNSMGQDRARGVLQQLYRPLYLIETPLVFTGIETAELTKYAANGFLAMKIAFINEMADVCEQVGANVQDVAKAMGLDGRIGRKFLHVGPGYGGSCFPKDTVALTRTARDAGAPTSLIESVVKSNNDRKQAMAHKIRDALKNSHDKTDADMTVAILGLTFKPNTDDMRDAPSLTIIPLLQEAGITIQAYDPVGQEEAARHLKNVKFASTAYEAMVGADAVIILTEWNEFRALDFDKMASLLTHPLLIDLRNIYRPDEMTQAGFDYVSIGRPVIYGTRNTVPDALSVA
jgi:UDPglucose 6-dehydrogenase